MDIHPSSIENNLAPVGIIVCGPCACGKSVVASALAEYFKVPYLDADTYHSKENIGKMSKGIPLTDEDRFPWLASVRKEMTLQKKEMTSKGHHPVTIVSACSALTRKYRQILNGSFHELMETDALPVLFVFLNCSEDVLQTRINKRQGHFMKGNMVSSQLAILEVPYEEVANGQAVVINGDAALENVVNEAISKLEAIFISRVSNKV